VGSQGAVEGAEAQRTGPAAIAPAEWESSRRGESGLEKFRVLPGAHCVEGGRIEWH
jgi:hypothetical protein